MEDLISRQAAINTAMKEVSDKRTHDFNAGVTRVANQIKTLPSAQPEREKGKWIVYYECPKCGEITKDFTEYCPFCNADMRGKEDE